MAENQGQAPVPVLTTSLKRLDLQSLQTDGFSKVFTFLNELWLGLQAGKDEIPLNIPFIQGEGDQINRYTLYVRPQSQIPDSTATPPITLADIAALIDEITLWLQTDYLQDEVFGPVLQKEAFRLPLLRRESQIIPDQLLEKDRRQELETQVELLLPAFAEKIGAPSPVEKEAATESSAQTTPSETTSTIESAIAGPAPAAAGATTPESDTSGETTTETPSDAVVPPTPLPGTPEIPPEFRPADWDQLSTYERQVYAYQAISTHAGFLYNQINSYIYTVYGFSPADVPPELKLTPYLEYELRQAILQELYQLNPAELRSLDRFRLGRSIFEKIVLGNPRVLALIEIHIEKVAAETNKPLPTHDPLEVWSQASTGEKIEHLRQHELGPEPPEPITDPATQQQAAQTYSQLTTVVDKHWLDRSFVQSDRDFIEAAMTIKGMNQVDAINIRRLVNSYIQTTGLDPERFISNLTQAEVSYLFNFAVPPEQLEQFKTSIKAYWQYQLQKLERVTKASIQPDKDLVLAVENDKIDEKNIGALKDDVEQFDQQCFQEGRDPRWYALASLITPEQLQDQAARNAFRTQLLELYQGDEAAADRALGAVQSIQQDQKAAIIAQLNQNFSHRDLSNLYARATGTTQLKTSAGTTEEVTENYIEKLSLKDREELAKSFLSVYSPQTAYVVINDYVDQEMDAAAVAAGLSAAAYYDQMADEYLLGGSALTETGLGSSPLFRRLGGQPSGAVQRLQQLSQVRKNFSRFRTLGKTATALRAGGGLLSATPAGMAGAALGGLFALGGDKQTGERIQTIATIGALAAPVVTFITGAISAALPVLGWIGGAILGGGAISSIASALGGFGNLANNTFVRPVISGGPPAVGPLGPNGLPIGAPAGPGAGLAGATPAGVGAGAAGAGGVGTATGAAAAGGNVFANFSMGSVATVGAVGGSIVAATVVAITNQGTFLTPERFAALVGETSPYVEMTKTVNPNVLENNTTATLSYTITISPKEDYIITPILEETTDTFTYVGGSPLDLASPIDQIRQQLGSEPINPGETREISYTIENVSGVDVQVGNTFNLVFTVEGVPDQQNLRRSAFVRIGNPKVGCFTFMPAGSNISGVTSKEWTEEEKAEIQEAFSVVASNPKFNELICTKGGVATNIELYRLEGDRFGGWAPHIDKIGMYDLGIDYSVLSTRYTLMHELGHIMDYRNSGLNAGLHSVKTRTGCYSYPYPDLCSQAEAFAEAIALFIVVPGTQRLDQWYLFNYDQPVYNWINENIFNFEDIIRPGR